MLGSRGLTAVAAMMTGHKRCLVIAAVTVYGLLKVTRYIKLRKLRSKWALAGKDVVVLHTLPRGNYSPSISPFGLKLETFLRMADIKYTIDYEEPLGPKGKLPWITLNGKDYADTELIIHMLQLKFDKFPDSNIPKEDRAVGLAMRVMMEDHFMWGFISWRYLEDDMRGLFEVQDLPLYMRILFRSVKGKLRRSLYLQGMGRHSVEEIHGLMKRDIEALSAYLGDKPFLLGSTPQVADCAIFGWLAQILYSSPRSPSLSWITTEFPNLLAYTERMKEQFWADWQQCITKPEFGI